MWQCERTHRRNQPGPSCKKSVGTTEHDHSRKILLQVCFRVTIFISRSYQVTKIISYDRKTGKILNLYKREHIELIHSSCFCPSNGRFREVSRVSVKISILNWTEMTIVTSPWHKLTVLLYMWHQFKRSCLG